MDQPETPKFGLQNVSVLYLLVHTGCALGKLPSLVSGGMSPSARWMIKKNSTGKPATNF